MSFRIIALVQQAKFAKMSAAKLVALKLAECANDDGSKIFPAVATIADDTELGRRTVQRWLRAFEDVGLLICLRRSKGGPGQSSQYSFNKSLLQQLAAQTVALEWDNRDKKFVLADQIELNSNRATVTRLPNSNRATNDTNRATNDANRATVAQEPVRTCQNQAAACAAAAREQAQAAFELFVEMQKACGFAKVAALTPERHAKLTDILQQIDFAVWADALRRASFDDFCTGKKEPKAGYSKRHRMTIDQMCDVEWVEHCLGLNCYITPSDTEWAAWRVYYKTQKPHRYKSMIDIEAKQSRYGATSIVTDSWLPPTQEQGEVANG